MAITPISPQLLVWALHLVPLSSNDPRLSLHASKTQPMFLEDCKKTKVTHCSFSTRGFVGLRGNSTTCNPLDLQQALFTDIYSRGIPSKVVQSGPLQLLNALCYKQCCHHWALLCITAIYKQQLLHNLTAYMTAYITKYRHLSDWVTLLQQP